MATPLLVYFTEISSISMKYCLQSKQYETLNIIQINYQVPMPLLCLFVTEITSGYHLTTMQKSNHHKTLPSHLPKVALPFLVEQLEQSRVLWLLDFYAGGSREQRIIIVTNSAIEQALLAYLIIFYSYIKVLQEIIKSCISPRFNQKPITT